MSTPADFLIGVLGAEVQSPRVRRRIRADDVLVISDHVPHRLGLVEKAHARMRSKDPAQKSRPAPTHPDDEHRAIDCLPCAACGEAQVRRTRPGSTSARWW